MTTRETFTRSAKKPQENKEMLRSLVQLFLLRETKKWIVNHVFFEIIQLFKNTKCIVFCFFVRNVRFEPRMAYSYVLGSTWLGDIKSVTLVWTYSSSVFNPLTWRILTVPALHVNRIIVHNLESNSRY